MITTKDVDVDLEKGIARLDQKTTKDIDVSFKPDKPKKETKPKEVIRPQSISTHNMQDVADILEKKKRDEIIAEMKKLDKKDEKKLIMTDEKKTILINNEGDSVIAKRKPWKEMTDEEKKVAYKERAKRAKITREAKKKKK